MSPVALTQQGGYPLLGVGALPNADVAFPGEVWSHKRANGVIVPGTCVRPVMVSGVECVQPVAADTIVDTGAGLRSQDLAVALRQIMVPDINPGSQYNPVLGPNEIVNLPIADQDYVRTYHSGVLHLTLVALRRAVAPSRAGAPEITDGTGARASQVTARQPRSLPPAGRSVAGCSLQERACPRPAP